jgi:hypothetical protein
MPNLKNVEIARKYNISEAAVTGWIKDSQNKLNNLQLEKVKNKFQVIDNEHNQAELQRLSDNGKKYRALTSYKKVYVGDEFYQIFSQDEQLELYTDLLLNRKVNLKFYYKGSGANVWDSSFKSTFSGIQNTTEILIQNSLQTLISRFSDSEKINLIDIGIGNGYPVKSLLTSLKDQNKLGNYIGVDISDTMAKIASDNLKTWFPKVSFNFITRDIENFKFTTTLIQAKAQIEGSSNLICFLGNTISNQTDQVNTLSNIKSGMLKNDLLMFTTSIDSIQNRSLLNYMKNDPETDLKYAWIPLLFGIDVSKCNVVLEFDSANNRKIKAIELDKDYDIVFKQFGKEEVVKLLKGERLLRWEHYLYTLQEVIADVEKAGLNILKIELDKSKSNALVVCEV